MRLAYLGTSEYAVAVLRRLADSRHRPALVVTPPNRRRGRGRQLAPPPAAAAATELGIALHQTENVSGDAAAEAIRAARADLGLVCAFGQLIRPPLLDELEMLNVHPSLLPRWRGAAPIERAIMAGDDETGVSIMRLTEGLDSGPVALREAVPIDPRDDYGALSARLATVGGDLAVRALDLREQGELSFEAQDESLVTYAEKIEPAERRLDPGRPAAELERLVRALTPHVGAWLELEGGDRLGVVQAEAGPNGGTPGELEADDSGALLLGCGEGSLRISVVRPAGKREMQAADYLRGHGVPRPA